MYLMASYIFIHYIESGIRENDNNDHFNMHDYHIFSMEITDILVIFLGVALDVKDITMADCQV